MEQLILVNSIILWIVVLFNLLLTLATVRRLGQIPIHTKDMNSIPLLEVGAPAPDFQAKNLLGETVSLADYSQRKIALIFISSTCHPCLEKLPTLERIGTGVKSKGVELLLIADDDLDQLKSLASQHKLSLPLLSSPHSFEPETSNIWQDYKVAGTPFYCFIGEDKTVHSTGFLDAEWEKTTQAWAALAEL